MLRTGEIKVKVLFIEMAAVAEVIAIEPGYTDRPVYGLAVDIGTKTIAAYLVDLEHGRVISTAGAHNRARFGDDVISRIIHSVEEEGGLTDLYNAVIDTVNSLIFALLEKHRYIIETDLIAVMLAGNTTMTHLFYAISPKYIWLETYIPTANSYL